MTNVVALHEIKMHVRVDDTDEDIYLASLADAAVAWMGSWLGFSVEDLDPMPAQVKHAVLLLVGDWYSHREATAEKAQQRIPFGVEALLLPLRRWVPPSQ